MDDLIAEFLAETNEGLSALDNDLVQLEMEPENEELISRIFRILHTIKGTCGFLGLPRLEKVAHKGEDVLGLFREKKLAVTPVYVSLIFECFDAIKEIVTSIETTGKEPDGDDGELIGKLEAVFNGGESKKTASAPQDSPVIAPKKEAQPPKQSLPIDGNMVETLQEMAAELLVAHNQLTQAVQQREQKELFAPLQDLNAAVTDLQVEGLASQVANILQAIAGIASSAGFSRLRNLSLKTEETLRFAGEKKLVISTDYLDLLSLCFDTISEILAGIAASGKEPSEDDSALIDTLETILCEAVFASGGDAQAQEDIPDAISEEIIQEIVHQALPADTKNHPEQLAAKSDMGAAQSLRVNVDVLENLMTMVSELVLTRNQLLQVARQNDRVEFTTPLQHLNHVVSDLQEEVMKTRMQPIGNAWAKLPRIVRDVSKELGKNIDLEMHGNDTELDRQILEMIKDPLTHMIRNSADHGIEMPEERRRKGKPETGKIILSAYHQGGHINIIISDDGKGLPLDRIKKKILQNGLATEEQLAGLSPQQIQKYIFHAGFSTAEAVTSVSGRGVGMDVVRSNIEKIGGSIEMLSEEDKGTTFTIKIPLTLAIVSALIVGVADQRFAIPQLAISELVLAGKNNGHRIEHIDNTSVLRLRGNLLPLVLLSDLLGIPSQKDEAQYVVVTKVGSTSFGIIVDQVYDLEEIVIKPLSKTLKSLAIFSGNTILGDGCVIMILDPAGILKAVGVQEVVDNKSDEKMVQEATSREQFLLLFHAGDKTLKATPLALVSRLEEINTADIEYSNGHAVIQYLGHLMPIYNLDRTQNETQRRPLIILQHEKRSIGLIADQILDIAKYYGDLTLESDNEISDSIIINDKATDIINARLIAADGVFIREEVSSHA